MAINAADLLVNVRANVDDARRKIKDVDSDLDKLGGTFDFTGRAAKSFGIAAAAGFAALTTQAAIGPISAFVGALIPIGGLLAALPGVAAAGGAAFATLALGLHGTSDAFKALASGDAEKFAEALKKLAPNAREFFKALQAAGPAFSGLRLHVQNTLFEGLGFHVNRLAKTYIPALHDPMLSIARGFNLAARAVADFLSRADVVMDVRSIFSNTGKAATSLKDIFPDLTAAFLDFAAVGASLMPEFLTYLSGGAERLRAWADEARKSGKIEEWIRNGATAARDFGGVLLNVGQIIGTIGRAANNAFGGPGFLASMKANTQAVEDFLKSGTGQTALITFFQATKAAMEAVGPVLRELFLAFTTGLVPALSNLAVGVAPGVVAILAALREGLIILQPAFATVGAAVGSLLTSLAPLIPVVAQFVANLIDRLAPHLPTIIAGLVGLFVAFKALAFISGLVTTFGALSGVLAFLVTPVGLVIVAIAALVAGLVIAYAKSEEFRKRVNDAFRAVSEAAGRFLDYFTRNLWPGIQRAWEQIKEAFTSGEGSSKSTMQRFMDLLDRVRTFVVTFGEAIKVAFLITIAGITAAWDLFGAHIVTYLKNTADNLIRVLDGLFTILTGLFNVFIGVFTGNWGRAWDGVKAIFTGAGQVIQGIFDQFINKIMFAVGVLWAAMQAAFSAGWEAVKGATTRGINSAVTEVQGIPGRVRGALASLGSTLHGIATSAWGQFKGAMEAVGRAVFSYVQGIPGKITGALGNLGRLLYNAGRSIMDGLREGITDAGRAVLDKARSIADGIKNVVGKVLDVNSPSKVMDQIGRWTGKGLANGLDAMKRTVARAGADMAAAAIPTASPGTGLAPSVSGLTAASGGASVSVAPGAVQVIIQGNVTEATLPQVQSSVDDAFQALLAEIKGGRVPGRVA